MKIDNVFTIDAPVESVWSALLDLERVGPCMPGAQIEGPADDAAGAYRGRFRIKIGPVSAAYRGRIEIVGRDDMNRQVILRGSGSDTGGGTATATISSRVVDRDGASEVHMTTDLDVTGRLAQFGARSSLSQSVADRVVSQFAEQLRQELAAQPAVAGATVVDEASTATAPSDDDPLDGVELVRSIAREQLGKVTVLTAISLMMVVVIWLAGRAAANRSR